MTPPARHTIEAWRFAFGGWLRAIQRRIRAGRRAAAMLTKPCVSAHVITSILSRSAVLILERGASITTSATFGHPAWWTGSPNPPVRQRLRCFYVGRRLLEWPTPRSRPEKQHSALPTPFPGGDVSHPARRTEAARGKNEPYAHTAVGVIAHRGDVPMGQSRLGVFPPGRDVTACAVSCSRQLHGTNGVRKEVLTMELQAPSMDGIWRVMCTGIHRARG